MRRRLLSQSGLDYSQYGYVWIATSFINDIDGDLSRLSNIQFEIWDDTLKLERGTLEQYEGGIIYNNVSGDIYKVPDDVLKKYDLKKTYIRVIKSDEDNYENGDFFIVSDLLTIMEGTNYWTYVTLYGDYHISNQSAYYYSWTVNEREYWPKYASNGRDILYDQNSIEYGRSQDIPISIPASYTFASLKGFYPFADKLGIYAAIESESPETITDERYMDSNDYTYIFDGFGHVRIIDVTSASTAFYRAIAKETQIDSTSPKMFADKILFFVCQRYFVYPWFKGDRMMEYMQNGLSSYAYSYQYGTHNDSRDMHNVFNFISNNGSTLWFDKLPVDFGNGGIFNIEFLDANGYSLGLLNYDVYVDSNKSFSFVDNNRFFADMMTPIICNEHIHLAEHNDASLIIDQIYNEMMENKQKKFYVINGQNYIKMRIISRYGQCFDTYVHALIFAKIMGLTTNGMTSWVATYDSINNVYNLAY